MYYKGHSSLDAANAVSSAAPSNTALTTTDWSTDDAPSKQNTSADVATASSTDNTHAKPSGDEAMAVADADDEDVEETPVAAELTQRSGMSVAKQSEEQELDAFYAALEKKLSKKRHAASRNVTKVKQASGDATADADDMQVDVDLELIQETEDADMDWDESKIYSTMTGVKLLPKPSILQAELHTHQVAGISWMVHMFQHGIPMILGDQVLAFVVVVVVVVGDDDAYAVADTDTEVLKDVRLMYEFRWV